MQEQDPTQATPRTDLSPVPTRREFNRRVGWTAMGLTATLTGLGGPARRAEAGHHENAISTGPPIATALLEKSPFVYISPLKTNGGESRCHAELWYAWLDESIVVTVASDRWKASALARGLDRARIWVGDHGLWKTWYGGHNEDFREAPHFDARAEKVEDPKLLARLLDVYERKYPEEIADWRDVMRTGNADGSRIVIRYTPTRS